MKKKTLKQHASSSAKSIARIFPILIGMIMLISILTQFLSKEFYANIFKDNILLDPLIGSIAGSISIGGPAISYILGGEMLSEGVSLVAITAFMVSFISVGVLTLPLETHFFGKKFAIIRNILSFVFSIIVAIITITILNLI
ncbi:hypothetical protein KAI32_02145 [Candidatus Pacearchaeota archaeon]|nr:hypothetical protein [Candidatus Pacearchaeota archaeon]